MISSSAAISRRIRSHMDQIVAELRRAGSAVENDGLSVHGMTEVLKSAMSDRNRLEAALTGGIGALDRVAERVPDGQLTAGLSSVKNGYHHRCRVRPPTGSSPVRRTVAYISS